MLEDDELLLDGELPSLEFDEPLEQLIRTIRLDEINKILAAQRAELTIVSLPLRLRRYIVLYLGKSIPKRFMIHT